MNVRPEAITDAARPIFAAIDKALDNLPQPRTRSERERWFMVSRATYVAAAPLIAAAQREADAQLAEEHRAHFDCDPAWGTPFARLLRGDQP